MKCFYCSARNAGLRGPHNTASQFGSSSRPAVQAIWPLLFFGVAQAARPVQPLSSAQASLPGAAADGRQQSFSPNPKGSGSGSGRVGGMGARIQLSLPLTCPWWWLAQRCKGDPSRELRTSFPRGGFRG